MHIIKLFRFKLFRSRTNLGSMWFSDHPEVSTHITFINYHAKSKSNKTLELETAYMKMMISKLETLCVWKKKDISKYLWTQYFFGLIGQVLFQK